MTILAERLTAQLLAGPPATSAVAVAERLLAVQGQDGRGARLAVRARSEGVTAADVVRGLTEERTLLITWLNRGTLHLVSSEDYPWLHALTTPPLFTGCARRLSELGVVPSAADRAVATIERALAEEGPLTRDELGARVARIGVETEGQALLHLLFLACLRGIAVRGPMVGKQHAYALVSDWLPPKPPALDRGRALAELARRFLAGHGPASDRDLAKWTGLPLRDARAGLQAIAPQLASREDGLAALAGLPPRGRDSRGHGCSGPSTPSSSDGCRERRSSGSTRAPLSRAASSVLSCSRAAVRSGPGGSPHDASCSSRSYSSSPS